MSAEKQKKSTTVKLPKHLQHINVHAAGIDVGSRSHFVAVPEGTSEPPVREFESFTDDLHRMADWLITCDVNTVVMESTSIYWIPVFEILESKGLEVKLVNARHVKNVPGRKSDVLDCQWLQRLHTYGLLEGAFRPPEQICTLAVSSEQSLDGKLFVQFIALIYLSYITKKMLESKLFKSHTLQEVLDELDVIECFEVPGRRLQVGETTKRQMELYTKLGVQAPTSLQ